MSLPQFALERSITVVADSREDAPRQRQSGFLFQGQDDPLVLGSWRG